MAFERNVGIEGLRNIPAEKQMLEVVHKLLQYPRNGWSVGPCKRGGIPSIKCINPAGANVAVHISCYVPSTGKDGYTSWNIEVDVGTVTAFGFASKLFEADNAHQTLWKLKEISDECRRMEQFEFEEQKRRARASAFDKL